MADLNLEAPPNYLLAADNHNLAAENDSWLNSFNPLNAGKFLRVATLSGINQFYTTGQVIGSWFSSEEQEVQLRDTAKWISSFDSDLGKYYEENQQGADIGGFLLGAIVPGLGGVKALRAGQKALLGFSEGMVGSNLSKATGLLVPRTEMYIKASATEINSSLAAVSLMNANTTKALASGVWQNVLEGVAAETVIQATMFASPVLDNQSAGDVARNILTGGLLSGAIGGSIDAARTFGKLKQARALEDARRLPFIGGDIQGKGVAPADKIIRAFWDLEQTAVPMPALYDAAGNLTNNAPVNKALYALKQNTVLNEVRTAIHELSGSAKDRTLFGNVLANFTTPIKDKNGVFIPGYSQQMFEALSGVDQIVMHGKISKLEKYNADVIKAGDPDAIIPTEFRYLSFFGDDAGKLTDLPPEYISWGDLYQSPEHVLNAIKSTYQFSLRKEYNLWDGGNLKGLQGVREAEARQIWARHIAGPLKENTLVHENDIPLIEKALREGVTIRLASKGGKKGDVTIRELRGVQELSEHLVAKKMEIMDNYIYNHIEGRMEISTMQRAAMLVANAPSDMRETLRANPYAYRDRPTQMMLNQVNEQNYYNQMGERGFKPGDSNPEIIDPQLLPKYAKIVYKVEDDVRQETPHIANAIAYYQARQAQYELEAKNVVATHFGEDFKRLPDITLRMLETANRNGSGASLFGGENGNYGTLSSMMAWVGGVVRDVEVKWRKTLSENLAPSLNAMSSKLESAIEFQGLNQKINRSGTVWFMHEEAGKSYMVTARAKKFLDNATFEDDFGGSRRVNIDDVDAYEMMEITHKETADFIRAHIAETGKRTTQYKSIRNVQGHPTDKAADAFRPIRPNLNQYPFFSFVRDDSVTSNRSMTVITAGTAKELAALEDKARALGKYTIINKSDIVEYKKARMEYDASRALGENYLDADMKNNGIFSEFFPKSDPAKIADDIVQQHYRESDLLVKENVRLRYEPLFAGLEKLGDAVSKSDTSKFGSSLQALEAASDNPYLNYIKTGLNVSKINEHPILYAVNKTVDQAFSRAYTAIFQTGQSVKTPEELEKINAALQKYAIQPGYYDAALQALANHPAPKGVLTQFVRRANAMLSLFVLGLDPLNAVNNAIGANILRFTELNHITRAISQGNQAVAGDLSKLAKIAVPGTPSEMFAPTKLVSQAISNFFRDDGTLINRYRALGIVKNRADQLKMLVDDFTLRGTETAEELQTRTNTAFARFRTMVEDAAEKGERATGNVFAEEFNRFISANVMDQITQLARKHNLMDESQSLAYINTFVNRVEGNILASQRPMVFQGPIGQAIGLFQSYQFNLLQQLFRYVAEGTKKDMAMLLGLQSTLYGAQSLPAFQYINTHIIGTASGNTNHTDAYDAVYGITNRQLGDLILYGLPSSLIQTNIYSRGDINPRQWTILPTNMQEVPAIAGWGKFFGNLYETFTKAAGGGDLWQTVLQGLEHNGISRPLSGIAQTLQALPDGEVYSTTNRGNIIYSHDLFHLGTLSRLAGGRPLDEALINDALFRVKTYEAVRRQDLMKLGERVKTSLIGGQEVSEEQLLQFAEDFAKKGGKQAYFNRWMAELYKNANTPQAEQIQMSLTNPFAYKMQLLMGGTDE